MEVLDLIKTVATVAAVVVSVIALRNSKRTAREQREFSGRLKKVEIRDSMIFDIVKEGGQLINSLNGKMLTYYRRLRDFEAHGALPLTNEVKDAIRAFGNHTTNAEQHLPDDLMAEFRKMMDANVPLYRQLEDVAPGDVYTGKPNRALGDFNEVLVQWQPPSEHFKEVLKTFSRQADF